jgi:hypothetical protein
MLTLRGYLVIAALLMLFKLGRSRSVGTPDEVIGAGEPGERARTAARVLCPPWCGTTGPTLTLPHMVPWTGERREAAMINFANQETAALVQVVSGAYNRAVRKHIEVYCLVIALLSIAAIAVIH